MNYQLYRTSFFSQEPDAVMTVGAVPSRSFLLGTGNPDEIEYLQWLSEGNTPEPAPVPEPAPEPTPAEKLAAAGLTVDELKALLGI